MAMILGGRKLIGRESVAEQRLAELVAAYDLEQDPGEGASVLDGSAPWPAPLFERLRTVAELLLVPVVGPEAAQLTEERLQELRDLGYGGEL